MNGYFLDQYLLVREVFKCIYIINPFISCHGKFHIQKIISKVSGSKIMLFYFNYESLENFLFFTTSANNLLDNSIIHTMAIIKRWKILIKYL